MVFVFTAAFLRPCLGPGKVQVLKVRVSRKYPYSLFLHIRQFSEYLVSPNARFSHPIPNASRASAVLEM